MTTDEAILKLQELKIASLNENPLNGLSPMHEALDMAIEALQNKPVHCVKCKYRDEMKFCILNDIFINEKDFCSKGIRRDGDEHAGQD